MDVKNLPIATVEYSVTRMAEDIDNVKTNSTLSAVVSKPSDILTSLFSSDEGNKEDDGKGVDESLSTKSVHLTTEIKPDGRTYMTKK